MTIKRDGWVAFSDDHVAVATCEGKQVTTEVHAYPEGAGRMALGVSVWTRNKSGGHDINSADTSMPRQVAVAWLRHALREFAGPSIDDVREAWGVDDPANCVCAFDRARWRWSVWLYDADGRPTTYSGNTEREALQVAYDAGVAQQGGTTP